MKIWIWDLRRCNFLLSWRDYFSLFLLLSRYSITFSILPPLSQPYFHATLGELRDPYFQNVGYVPQDPPVAPPVVRFKGETAGGPVSDVYPGPQSGSQRAWHYLASMVIELNLVYERKFVMFSHCLKFHQIIHDTIASVHQQVLAKRISWVSGLSHAVNALTLARQIWRHNYVIGRNEYLISTLLACTVP